MDHLDQERVPMTHDGYGNNEFVAAGVDSQFLFANDDKFPDCFVGKSMSFRNLPLLWSHKTYSS